MAEVKNKLEFTVGDVKLCVKKPNYKQKRMAEIHYSRAFAEALKNGCALRESIRQYSADQNVDNLQKHKDLLQLMSNIEENTVKLEDPNISIDDGVLLATQIKLDRMKIYSMRSVDIALDNVSAEGLADNEKFNYLVAVCTFKEDGKPYFKDLNDYFDQGDDEIAITAASKLANLIYGLDDDFEKNLVENVYLEKAAKKEEEQEKAELSEISPDTPSLAQIDDHQVVS